MVVVEIDLEADLKMMKVGIVDAVEGFVKAMVAGFAFIYVLLYWFI